VSRGSANTESGRSKAGPSQFAARRPTSLLEYQPDPSGPAATSPRAARPRGRGTSGIPDRAGRLGIELNLPAFERQAPEALAPTLRFESDGYRLP